MRLSFLISVLVHLLMMCAVVFVFKTVPEMKLPKKIYSVKILQPIIKREQPKQEAKPEVKVEKKEVSKPAPKKKEPEKKPEKKPEPEPDPPAEEKPLDVSVDKDESQLTSLEVEGPRFPFSYYLSAIERKVSKNWFSSQSGRGEGYTCVVYFRLQKNGRVSEVRVEQASGSSYFDRAAQRAIRSSAPFPPLPKAFSEPWLGIHFTFIQKD